MTGQVLRTTDTQLRQLIREELMLSEPAPALPPPNDVVAERMVITALLDGVVVPSELPILGRHFYNQVFAYVFALIDERHRSGEPACRTDLLAAALRREGFPPGVLQLLEATHNAPYVIRDRAHKAAKRVLESSKRRELEHHCASGARALRAGADFEQVAEPLESTLMRLRRGS